MIQQQSNNRNSVAAVWPNILWQPVGAIIFIAAVLFALNSLGCSAILWAIGAGALSSSANCVFTHPDRDVSQPKHIILGYVIGMVCGLAVRFLINLSHAWLHTDSLHAFSHYLTLVAAVVVGIVLWVMVYCKCEHPPATGLALVLVIDLKHYDILFVIMAAAIVLAGIKALFAKHLVSLR